MATQIGLAVIYLISLSLLLIFNEMIYRRLNLKGEITRKFAHFTATLSTLTFPHLFNDHWYVLILALIFFFVLYLSRNSAYLRSIHDINRPSAGSYLLPLAIYFTFLISHLMGDRYLFILPMMILAICDPVAGILGINLQQYNQRIRIFNRELQKTWLGSTSFLISSFFISVIVLYLRHMSFDLKTFWLAVIIAITGTVAELLSYKGSDNLFIPMSVLIVLLIAF